MLHLAESVAKRSRRNTDGIGGADTLDYYDSEGESVSQILALNSHLRPNTRLHVNLNPDPGPCTIPKTDGFCGGSNGKFVSANKISLADDARLQKPSELSRNRLSLDSEDLEKRQDWLTFDDAQQDLGNRSWDEIDQRLNLKKGFNSYDNDSLFSTRQIDYDDDVKRRVLSAASNAALGFSSDCINWNPQTLQLELKKGIRDTSFANYLEQFARTGSLIRRLNLAVDDIRQLTSTQNARTILALASAIEKQVTKFKMQGSQVHHSNRLIDLAKICRQRGIEVETLADLIGCSGPRGRLARIPSVVDLLQRVYLKACLVDSEMLWSLTMSCLTPWLDQLNFVIGLVDPLTSRTLDVALKQACFPEIFIEITSEPPFASMNKEQIPSFISNTIAHASFNCYTTLCYLGIKGPDAVKRASHTKLSPIQTMSRAKGLGTFAGLRPRSISDGLNLLESLDSAPNLPEGDVGHPSRSRDSSSSKRTSSMQREVRKMMNKVFLRSAELDHQAKIEFSVELRNFQKVVVGVYFLTDGVLWSQLSDPITSLLEHWSDREYHSHLDTIQELVSSEYPEVDISIDKSFWGNLRIGYHPPPHMKMIFGNDYLKQCQVVFSKIVLLHWNKDQVELALLGSDLQRIACGIEQALTSPSSGMREVRTAFNEISRI